MLHELINTETITRWSKDWREFHDKFENTGLPETHGRLLLRKNRRENPAKFLNEISRVYKKAQHQYNNWRQKYLLPILREAEKRAIDDRVIMHAKPTHEFEPYRNYTWWAYDYSKQPKPYRWGYSFDWIEEPKEKLNHDLGQALYESDRKSRKYQRRIYILEKILAQELSDYLYKIYSYNWLDENQFSGKIIKFNLQGDEYWYKIGCARRSVVPIWDNIIWQNKNTEEINL
jgi:hypothetical protein